MRHKFILRTASLALLSLSWSQSSWAVPYVDEVLSDNPAGYWRFENTDPAGVAIDSSPNGRHGGLVGGVTTGAAPGAGVIGGFAGLFDGLSGFVQLPGSWGGAAELTVEAWVNTSAIRDNFQTIVGTPSGGVAHFQVAPFGNTVAYTDAGVIALAPPGEGPINTWRHIALTAKSGETKIYVDGAPIDSNATAFSSITASSDVHIGNGHVNTRWFTGLLDEVAIYDTALSPARISAHYTAGSSAPPVPPMVIMPAGGFSIGWNSNDGDHINGPVPTAGNLALAPGAVAFGSGELGAPSHTIANVKDGIYGNPNSWIAAPGDNPEFIGIDLGGSKSITSIAWSRSNSDDFRDPCGAACTDRALGTYTVQVTSDAVVDGASAWVTVGTIRYDFAEDGVPGGGFTPWLRHEFTLAENGNAITATGLRILTSLPALHPLAIDELEIYGVPEPSSLALAVVAGLFGVGLVRRRKV